MVERSVFVFNLVCSFGHFQDTLIAGLSNYSPPIACLTKYKFFFNFSCFEIPFSSKRGQPTFLCTLAALFAVLGRVHNQSTRFLKILSLIIFN